LFDDAILCTDWLLSQGITVGLFTNSSAILNNDSEFNRKLQFYLTAGDVGAAKPSRVPFMAICQRVGINPRSVIYVGDDYENDIVGASRAGMKTALIIRQGNNDSTENASLRSIEPDVQLYSLNPDEFQSKLRTMFRI
jgi:putative hydrolase of the HAD superfamily